MSDDFSRGLCIPHKARGRLVPAFYTIGGEGMCKECYSGKQVAAAQVKTETKSAPKEILLPVRKEIDWSQVQRDRDSGVPVTQLVKKYGVSNPTIYTRTHANGKKIAGGGKTGKPSGPSAKEAA
jgi:hypothetical protein